MKTTTVCKTCSKVFSSYNPNPTFCSAPCRFKSMMSKVDSAKVLELYESGMSQDEVAASLGTTQKVVYSTLKRMNYKCRVAAKRDQYGEKNTSWKGDNVTYAALHYRIVAMFGRPKKCDECGTTDESKRYDWACVGDYKKPQDYRRMCRSCHFAFDKIGNNFPNNDRTPSTKKRDFDRSCGK